jgi:hypothetical protein
MRCLGLECRRGFTPRRFDVGASLLAIDRNRGIKPLLHPARSRGPDGHKKAVADFPATADKRVGNRTLLNEVAGNELGELEHADGLLAVQNGLELVVGVDLGADLLVLKTVLLDVGPELLCDFGSWNRL